MIEPFVCDVKPKRCEFDLNGFLTSFDSLHTSGNLVSSSRLADWIKGGLLNSPRRTKLVPMTSTAAHKCGTGDFS